MMDCRADADIVDTVDPPGNSPIMAGAIPLNGLGRDRLTSDVDD